MNDQITAFKSSITSATQEVKKLKADQALAETALTNAEAAHDAAKADDGVIDPGELYDRRESAKREVFVRKSEVNRGNDKLEKAEAELGEVLTASTEPILAELTKRAELSRQALRKEFSDRLSKTDSRSAGALHNFIECCPEVSEVIGAIGMIQQGIQRRDTHGIHASGLRKGLEEALRLL